MMGIPVVLNLEKRRCVIVGGGSVGIRQAKKCLQAGAEVFIISPSLVEEISGIQHLQARYERSLMLNLKPFLVAAATNHPEVNAQIVTDAQQANLLTMRLDSPNEADVKGLMAVEVGDFQITAASGTPLLSRYLLEKYAAHLTPELVTFAGWLKTLRPHVRNAIADQKQRAALWEHIFHSLIMTRIEAGDLSAARSELAAILGAELAAYLPETEI